MTEKKYTRLTRKEAIAMLVDIHEELYRDGDYFDVRDILEYGYRGVTQFTDRELLEELEIYQDPESPFQLVSIIHKELS